MSARWITFFRTTLYLALFAPLLIPPDIIYPTTVGSTAAFRIAVGFAASGVIWSIFVGKDTRLSRDPILLTLVLFLGVSTLAALLGLAPGRSLYGGVSRMGGVAAVLYGVLFYASVRTFIPLRQYPLFIGASFTVGVVVAGVTVLQLLLPGRSILFVPAPALNPSGTMSNSGLLAGYLLVILWMGFWLLVRTSSKVKLRAGIGGGMLMVVAGLLITQNRATFLAGTGALLLAMLMVGARAPARRHRAALAVVAAVAVGILAATFLIPTNPLTQAVPTLRSLSTINLHHPTLAVRAVNWRAAFVGFPHAPLLGVGPENFGLVYTRHHEGAPFEALASPYEDRSHNVFVEALSTTGVLGLLAYAAVWMAVAVMVLGAYRERRISFVEVVAIGGAGVAYMLYLQMWFHELNALIPLLSLAAYLSALGETEGTEESQIGVAHRRYRAAFAIGGIAVLLGFTYKHSVIVVRAAGALAEAVYARGFDTASIALQRHRLGRVPEAMEVLSTDARSLLNLSGRVTSIRENPAEYARVLSSLTGVEENLQWMIGADPWNDRWRSDMGDVFIFAAQLTGNPDYAAVAIDHFNDAAELSPRRLTPLFKATAAHTLIGDRAGALGQLEQARLRAPDEGRVAAFEARFYVTEEEFGQAAEAERRAWQLGYCGSGELEGILREFASSAAYDAAAELAAAFVASPCAARVALNLRLQMPIYLLRAGRDEEAIRAAESVGEADLRARALTSLFARDVSNGHGAVWARYPSLTAAAREFGAGPLGSSGR